MRFTLLAFLLVLAGPSTAENLKKAVFAGGCFWCVEKDFDQVDGVVETISGFAGGTLNDPSYKQVVRGGTGHAEAVEITYDADVVSYEGLLHIFWRSVDPTDAGGQFCDRGSSYRTEVFVSNDQERDSAIASRVIAQTDLGQKIVTQISDLEKFYPAEKYHQNFYQKSPVRYKTYRKGCGRDKRVQMLWGDAAAFAHSS